MINPMVRDPVALNVAIICAVAASLLVEWWSNASDLTWGKFLIQPECFWWQFCDFGDIIVFIFLSQKLYQFSDSWNFLKTKESGFMAQIGKVFNLLLVLLYRSTDCCWRSSICKRRCWYRTRDCSGSMLRIFWGWWQNFDIGDIFWILMLDSYVKRWWR